jgi:hypothetical protein
VEPLRKQAANTQVQLNDRETTIAAIRNRHLDPGLVRLGNIRRELEDEFRTILGGAG